MTAVTLSLLRTTDRIDHSTIRNCCMSPGLNQYLMVTNVHSVSELSTSSVYNISEGNCLHSYSMMKQQRWYLFFTACMFVGDKSFKKKKLHLPYTHCMVVEISCHRLQIRFASGHCMVPSLWISSLVLEDLDCVFIFLFKCIM